MIETHPEALHFRDIGGALRRRWKLITAFGVAATLLSVAVGLILPPRYTAKAQMVIEIPDTRATLGWLDEEAVQTRVQLLLSVSHLNRLLETLSSDKENPAAAGISYDVLERNLNAYKELHSRVITVTYTDSDPVVAAFVANKSAAIYLDTLADNWRRERGDIKALDAQIPVVKAQLERAEATLQASRAQSGPAGSRIADATGTVRSSNQEARQSDTQMRGMEREAAATTQLYQNLLKRRNDLFAQEIPAQEVRIASLAVPPDEPSSLNPFLFVPPAVVSAIIIGAFLAITFERLDTSIRSQQDATETLGIPCVGLVPLFNGAPKSQQHFARLFARGSSTIRYLLAPIFQSLQKVGRLLPQISFLHSVREDEQKEDEQKKECPSSPSSSLSFLKNPFSPYSEAIRSTVLSVLKPKQETTHSQIVLITSSIQGEGKTTLAVGFAAYAALLERKVLLIDCDFRKPGILDQLAGSDDKGTLEVLEGHPVAGLIKHHPSLGIDYLPLPRHRVDPLPLLQYSNLRESLRVIAQDYDCVVIDSPPLLGTTETRLLSTVASHILLAIQWGSTRRDMVQQALHQLTLPGLRSRQPRVAAVITKVDLKLHSRYRFGDTGEVLARLPYRTAEPGRA